MPYTICHPLLLPLTVKCERQPSDVDRIRESRTRVGYGTRRASPPFGNDGVAHLGQPLFFGVQKLSMEINPYFKRWDPNCLRRPKFCKEHLRFTWGSYSIQGTTKWFLLWCQELRPVPTSPRMPYLCKVVGAHGLVGSLGNINLI